MVLFHSTFKSNRLIYILDYLFRHRLGLDYAFSDEIPDTNLNTLFINYSDAVYENAWNIKPNGLLMENLVNDTDQKPNVSDLARIAFPNSDFDFLSAIFFHLSRYEEYLCQSMDSHGRFPYTESIIYKSDMLEMPFIDLWVNSFKNTLIREFKIDASKLKNETFFCHPTIDIDSVFAYRGKGLFRQMGAIAKDLLHFNSNEISSRLKVLLGSQKDPNDNFDFQNSLLQGKKANYFIQVGKYGMYDKNVSPENPEFRNIIKSLKAKGHIIGLHPSYASNGNLNDILREKKTLENICGSEIIDSRQHFLKFNLPQTYRTLIEAGIKNEWSMGYSEVAGFRAGTAQSFYWFDLEKNQNTELLIHPFCVMDVAFKQFMGLDAQKSIDKSKNIKNLLKNNMLPFIFVFHNESLSGHRGWQNWDSTFRYWISEKD